MSLRSRHAGFTLLEVLLGVAMIAILATLAGNSIVREVRRNQREELAVELAALESGIRRFIADVGYVPQTTELEGALSVRGALPAAAPGIGGVPVGWNGPYVRAAMLGPGANDPFRDPWGAPYEIARNGDAWTLTSRGSDGLLATSDDISTGAVAFGYLTVQVSAADGDLHPKRLGPAEATVELFRAVNGIETAVSTANATGWSWDPRGQFFFQTPVSFGPHAIRVTGRGAYAGRNVVVVAFVDGNGSQARVTLP